VISWGTIFDTVSQLCTLCTFLRHVTVRTRISAPTGQTNSRSRAQQQRDCFCGRPHTSFYHNLCCEECILRKDVLKKERLLRVLLVDCLARICYCTEMCLLCLMSMLVCLPLEGFITWRQGHCGHLHIFVWLVLDSCLSWNILYFITMTPNFVVEEQRWTVVVALKTPNFTVEILNSSNIMYYIQRNNFFNHDQLSDEPMHVPDKASNSCANMRRLARLQDYHSQPAKARLLTARRGSAKCWLGRWTVEFCRH